ncbi:MAG: hypothetical protein ACOVKC_00310 [Brevundimonas sp.]
MTKNAIWNVDLKVYATAYVRASSAKEARQKLTTHFEGRSTLELEVREGPAGDFDISGACFDRDFPEISLSPAMTIHAPAKSHRFEFSDEGPEQEASDELEAA